jgi:hypothetical protein
MAFSEVRCDGSLVVHRSVRYGDAFERLGVSLYIAQVGVVHLGTAQIGLIQLGIVHLGTP